MSAENSLHSSFQIDRVKVVSTWTIKTFSKVTKNCKKRILSPVFCDSIDKTKKYRLSFYPIGYSNNRFSTLTLHFSSENKDTVVNIIDFKISVVNDGSTFALLNSEKMKSIRKASPLENPWNNWSFTFYELKDEVKLISSEDTLTIHCELTSASDRNVLFGLKFNQFSNEKFSDVNLRTRCGKVLQAHKLVLASVSPVFEAMFTHNTLESKNNFVDIKDISHETLVEMLRCIYSGTIEVDDTVLICELLKAADKYQIENLKNACENVLSTCFTNENVLDMITLADKHNAQFLKNKATNFIKCNMKTLIDSEEMKKFAQPLILDVIRLMIK
uniref:BTB domain-containing protein n=1 Tax=Trichogramma kaykai TaxID=54128 RepID=A0ABD2WHE9_9HYME